jgi:hypothetical protein
MQQPISWVRHNPSRQIAAGLLRGYGAAILGGWPARYPGPRQDRVLLFFPMPGLILLRGGHYNENPKPGLCTACPDVNRAT